MFSFVMVFLTITLITLIAIQRSLITEKREQLYLETRINSMNNLHESIVRDMKKALDIITTRAISVSISHIVTTGIPLDNADNRLEELVLEGTLYGVPQALMENATFGNWTRKMEEVGNLKGFFINITLINLDIKPYDSWNLEVQTQLVLNITDLQGVASLNRTATINTLVNLEGLEDPLYPSATGGIVSNYIVRTPFEGNFTQILLTGNGGNGWVYGECLNVLSGSVASIPVAERNKKILVTDDASGVPSSTLNEFMGIVSDGGINPTSRPYLANTADATSKLSNGTKILIDGDNDRVWYIDNFKEHAENSYYNASNEGPSFLDRLEGKFLIQDKYSSQTSNTIGLESFINKHEFWTLNINISENRTNVDYLYFNTSVDIDVESVKGLHPSFRIDDEHDEAYNVSDILI